MTQDQYDDTICRKRSKIFMDFIFNALRHYVAANNGQRPELIIIFRGSVEGPMQQMRVLEIEGPGMEVTQAFRRFDQNYNPELLYIFVDKHTQQRIFKKA